MGHLGSAYNYWRSRRIRRNAIAQELGGKSYLEIIDDVKRSQKNQHWFISRSNAWKIFLQSHQQSLPIDPNDEEGLYKDIRDRRAAHMLYMAQHGNAQQAAEAKAFITTMGISEIDDADGAGNRGYSKGAMQLLSDKLK